MDLHALCVMRGLLTFCEASYRVEMQKIFQVFSTLHWSGTFGRATTTCTFTAGILLHSFRCCSHMCNSNKP